jgi:hypothetical protein
VSTSARTVAHRDASLTENAPGAVRIRAATTLAATTINAQAN